MANKFYGIVGFAADLKEGRGSNEGIVKEAPIVEREYFGDVQRLSRRSDTGTDIIDDVHINVQISIVADDYINSHMHSIKYVDFEGTLWKVTSVEPIRPRIILTIGGVYNGPTPRTPS